MMAPETFTAVYAGAIGGGVVISVPVIFPLVYFDEGWGGVRSVAPAFFGTVLIYGIVLGILYVGERIITRRRKW